MKIGRKYVFKDILKLDDIQLNFEDILDIFGDISLIIYMHIYEMHLSTKFHENW